MALLLVFLLAACASTGLSDRGLEINGIEISNRSSSSVESFLLAVPKDGIEVSVNRIAEGSSSLNNTGSF